LAIRDSKDKAGPILLFAAHEWRAFVHGIKAAELLISLYGELVRAPFTVRRRRGLCFFLSIAAIPVTAISEARRRRPKVVS
jgi:hypothetical protein